MNRSQEKVATTLLYGVTVMTGGSVWLATKFQLGVVPPEVSLVYRFGIASALLFLLARLRGLQLRFGWSEHGLMLLLGVLIFTVNFELLYLAARHLTTGLIAVIFSTSVLMNIVNGAIFRRQAIERRTIAAAACGCVGIALVFGPDLAALDMAGSRGRAVVLAFAATFAFSLANVLASRNWAAGLPVLSSTAYSMAYGSIVLALVTLVRSPGVVFDPSASYVVSLLYLAIFGSVIGYGTYFELIRRIGAGRAAYATVLAPVLALALSAQFEGMVLVPRIIAGLVIILVGNLLILVKPSGA